MRRAALDCLTCGDVDHAVEDMTTEGDMVLRCLTCQTLSYLSPTRDGG